jgi:ESS family glutamate:Na+ symporter
MTAIASFCALCFLLVCGKAVRTAVPFLRKLYLPSSIVGGVLGLIILTSAGPHVPAEWHEGWKSIPGFLINIVFATMFIGKRFPNVRNTGRAVAEQFCFAQIIAWGMYVVGLALSVLVFTPCFGVQPAFGNLLEIGFEGGHGTVGGLSETFTALGWSEGSDLGYTMATIGMVIGITVGMTLVNWAVRKGHVKNVRTFEELSEVEQRGFYPPNAQPPAGKQTVLCDSIDSLAWHLAVIGLAVFVGYGLKSLLVFVGGYLPDHVRELRIIESIPLFPLCMLGGLFIQMLLVATRLDSLVDRGQINRLGGASLDFLVVAAVATIRLDFIVRYWQPLVILVVAGVAWSLFGAYWLARRMFSEDWFERAIVEFGQYTGVTATGLLLLRTVDPDSKTSASTVFGCKQLFHEPLIGGVWVAMSVPLVFKLGPWPVLLISIGALVLWILVWLLFLRRPRARNVV